MRYEDRQKHLRVIAIAKADKAEGQFVDIVMLSLIGLIFTLVEITQYAGTPMLRMMFAP